MRDPLIILVAVAAITSGPLLAANREWKTGKILDSRSARTYIQTGASTDAAETKIHTMVIQEAQLLIAGDVYAYLINDPVAKPVGLPTHGIVTRTIMNRGHGCRFVVGDDVKYSQEKSTLRVLDADGKECKLDILRQERLR